MHAHDGDETTNQATTYFRQEVREVIEAWKHDSAYVSRSDNWGRGVNRAFTKALASRGLIGITWPVEYGGRASTNTARLAVTEELLRAGAPTAAHWIGDRQIGPAILRYGTPELREEILPGITAGDSIFCLGMSEPEAGSDLASVATSARALEGGYVVKGRKTWTTGAHEATHMYLLARTESGLARHQSLSEFIIDMGWPGVEVSPIIDLSGEHHFNEVIFDDVFVPTRRLLGQAGNGWAQVVEQLSFERGGPERYLSTDPLFVELIHAALPERSPAAALAAILSRR